MKCRTCVCRLNLAPPLKPQSVEVTPALDQSVTPVQTHPRPCVCCVAVQARLRSCWGSGVQAEAGLPVSPRPHPPSLPLQLFSWLSLHAIGKHSEGDCMKRYTLTGYVTKEIISLLMSVKYPSARAVLPFRPLPSLRHSSPFLVVCQGLLFDLKSSAHSYEFRAPVLCHVSCPSKARSWFAFPFILLIYISNINILVT